VKHAKLSPSASARWLACAGSAEVNWGAPRVDNKYSTEGTSAHTLLEVSLRTGLPPDAFLGQKLKTGHDTVSDGMADAVSYAVEWVAAYMANKPKAELFIESKVDYDVALGLPWGAEVGFGYPDVQIDSGDGELVTLDYKHGVGVAVGVAQNSQLMLYAAGALTRLGGTRRHRGVIVQPRAAGRKAVQESTYTQFDLNAWIQGTVQPQVKVIMRDGKNAPRVAGSHCRYCAADGKCQAQFGAVQAAAAKEFVDGSAAMTGAQYAAALDTMARIEPLMASIKAEAVRTVHAGGTVPGYRVAWGPTRRQWADERAAEALLRKLGLGDACNTVSLVSPAQAEAALKAAKKWPVVKRGEAQAFTPLDTVVTQSPASATIKKATE
jgi:hypothetical protein